MLEIFISSPDVDGMMGANSRRHKLFYEEWARVMVYRSCELHYQTFLFTAVPNVSLEDSTFREAAAWIE
jgi:hypothetical protein